MKILIIRLSSLGDIILTQPVVWKLHTEFPEAELHYIAKARFREVPQSFGMLITVINYSGSIRQHLSLIKARYDLVFDLHNKLSSFLIKLFCPGAKKITYDKKHQLRRAIAKKRSSQVIDSTLELYLTALIRAGVRLAKPDLGNGLLFPKLFPAEEKSRTLRQIYHKQDGLKVIALFPGATHSTKMYPQESWVKFILAAGESYYFWLMGSREEKELTEWIHSKTGNNSVDLAGFFSPGELIDAIAAADAVITNDSGPMHIAAALNKPQVAVFGATHPKLGFRPLNPKAVVICKNISCQPCSLHGGKICPRKHLACLLTIKPEEVAAALKKVC